MISFWLKWSWSTIAFIAFSFLVLVRGDLPRPWSIGSRGDLGGNKGWPCVQRKLPGIDIPAATEANILHAAAFLESKQHVERLARAGSDLQAYTCWMHGVDVCHSPYVLATGTDSDLFPPCRRCPVAWTTVSAAQPTLAGSSFPVSVCGIAEALCCPQMWLPTKLGTTTISTRRWTFCWWRPTPTSLRHLTWSARSSTRFSSDAQRVTLGSWVWERSSTNGAHGVHGQPRSCQLLSSRAFTQGLPGGDPGQPGDKKELGHIGRFAAGWSQSSGALQLGTACIDCGDPTRRVCWSCCVGMCSACFTWRQLCGHSRVVPVRFWRFRFDFL